MAALDLNAQLTLLEMARRTDPKGNTLTIAEILNETNEVFQDIPWMEANGTVIHRVNRRTSLPTGTWRQINEGVATEASTTITINETLGLLESYSETDKWIIDNAPVPEEARMQEASAFLEGMGQTFVKTLFNRALAVNYGSTGVVPERFNGFPVRLNTLQAASVKNRNVIDGKGTGNDTTSVWAIQWGLSKVFMVYPKGSVSVGISHEDKGQVTASRATSSAPQTSQLEVYRDWFRLNAGLVVRDTRCYARYANIETTGSTNIFDEDILIELLNNMPMAGAGAKIYVNKTIKTQMEIALKDKANVYYSHGSGEGLAGVPILYFRGSPVRVVEQILDTETAIT